MNLVLLQKAKELPEWQSLLKGMGVAAEADDEIDCPSDVLRFSKVH